MRTIGVFETLFKKQKQVTEVQGYFKTLDAYTPIFTTYDGGVYEMELTRAAIHAFATHCSKLSLELQGTAYKELQNVLKFQPNPFMSTSQFLYRVATILSANNTCYIVPIEDDIGYITGYYPLMPTLTEVVQYQNKPYLRYTFGIGKKACIEYEKVGVLTNFQYKNDFKGESNEALNPTMQLIHTQNQGIIEGVKNSANIRFIAKVNNILKKEDIDRERKNFNEANLSAENNGGLVLFGNQYADVKQVDSQPFIINPAQMKLIQENVYNYFGINAEILQNKAIGDSWSAFYEGKIEPFAIQLSLALSNMTYTKRELSQGNMIFATANRLQYMTNQDKLQVSAQMFDRGIFNRNMIMDMWNLPPVNDGEKFYIRREYVEIDKLGGEEIANSQGQGIQNTTTIDDTGQRETD